MTNKLFASLNISEKGKENIELSKRLFSTLMNDIAVLDTKGGREFSIMKTKLEEANFYLNKSIAINNTIKERGLE
jgi:hypothetical protein